MINWLIKFLGGFTKEQVTLLEKEYEHQRELQLTNRARVEYLEKELSQEREERKFLQETIYKKFGFITPEEVLNQSQEQFQPISTGPTRWSGLKNRLEQDDRQRVTGMASKVS
jgi:hypothetical protein